MGADKKLSFVKFAEKNGVSVERIDAGHFVIGGSHCTKIDNALNSGELGNRWMLMAGTKEKRFPSLMDAARWVVKELAA